MTGIYPYLQVRDQQGALLGLMRGPFRVPADAYRDHIAFAVDPLGPGPAALVRVDIPLAVFVQGGEEFWCLRTQLDVTQLRRIQQFR